MRRHRRVASKPVVVEPVAELIAAIPSAFGAAQHPPASTVAPAPAAAASEPPAAASESPAADRKQAAGPRRRRSLSQDTEMSWGARLGAALAQLAGLRLGRTRSEPGQEAAAPAAGTSGGALPAHHRPGTAAAAAPPTSDGASPPLVKPAHPPQHAGAASGEQPGSPGSPGMRRLQRSMRQRPHMAAGGRPPRPPPRPPAKAAAAAHGAAGAKEAAREGRAASVSPSAERKPAALQMTPDVPAAPEASAERAPTAVTSFGAAAPLSPMPRKLKLELLALMRRQRDYVGLRQQVRGWLAGWWRAGSCVPSGHTMPWCRPQ